MNFLNDFILLLKARYPIIYVSTYEEERIEYIIRLCCKNMSHEHIILGTLSMVTKVILMTQDLQQKTQ